MALDFFDKEAQETGMTVNHLHTGAAKPDPELVDSLLHAVQIDTFAPTDYYRRVAKFTDTIRHGVIHREGDRFLPPKRLLPDRNGLGAYAFSFDARGFWRETADLILWKAQQEAFSDDQIKALQGQSRARIQNIRRSFSVQPWSQENVYFEYDAAQGDASELIAEIADFEQYIRILMRRAIEGVLRNTAAMQEIQQTAETHRRVVLEIVLKAEIDYLEYVRGQVEDPLQQAMLKGMLERALEVLGITDLDVELLSVKDALRYACVGLYTSAHDGQRAKVSVPMSSYGTTRLLDFSEILDTFAHEIAHHVVAQAKLKKIAENEKLTRYQVEIMPGDWIIFDVPSSQSLAELWIRRGHHTLHASVTYSLEQALKGLHFGWQGNISGAAPAWLNQLQTAAPKPLVDPDILAALKSPSS